MKLFPMLAMAASVSMHCLAQSSGGAQVFSGQDVATQLAALGQAAKVSGSSGAILGDYASHAIKLSVRSASGGAEIHQHFDDIFIVTGGKATLITGGTVVNPKTASDGETKGSEIQGGKSQTIAENDIVHIPAGTPHQLILASGNVFHAIVVKVRE